MGKGVALACAKRFDGLLDRYTAACERGEISVGRMWSFSTGLIIGPRLVICFPTKKHWAQPSQSNGSATAWLHLLKRSTMNAFLPSRFPLLVAVMGVSPGHMSNLSSTRDLALSRARSSCIHPDETKSFKASHPTADRNELHSRSTRELHLHDESIVVSREIEVNPLN